MEDIYKPKKQDYSVMSVLIRMQHKESVINNYVTSGKNSHKENLGWFYLMAWSIVAQ